MPFVPGQRVALSRSLQQCGFTLPKGSVGTVSSTHFQVCVLFDDFEKELFIAENDLTSSQKPPKPRAARAAGNFTAGTRVRLLTTTIYGSQTIPAGTFGTVTQDAPSMNASWVLFDGFSGDKLVPNIDLAPA